MIRSRVAKVWGVVYLGSFVAIGYRLAWGGSPVLERTPVYAWAFAACYFGNLALAGFAIPNIFYRGRPVEKAFQYLAVLFYAALPTWPILEFATAYEPGHEVCVSARLLERRRGTHRDNSATYVFRIGDRSEISLSLPSFRSPSWIEGNVNTAGYLRSHVGALGSSFSSFGPQPCGRI